MSIVSMSMTEICVKPSMARFARISHPSPPAPGQRARQLSARELGGAAGELTDDEHLALLAQEGLHFGSGRE